MSSRKIGGELQGLGGSSRESSEAREGHIVEIHLHNFFPSDPVICNPEGDSKWKSARKELEDCIYASLRKFAVRWREGGREKEQVLLTRLTSKIYGLFASLAPGFWRFELWDSRTWKICSLVRAAEGNINEPRATGFRLDDTGKRHLLFCRYRCLFH